MCNEKLKFGNLQDKARALGAEYIATGHYARIGKGPGGATLSRAVDRRKDQSYFLFSLREEQLARSLTPLGGLTKQEVRDVARKLGLKTYDKEESQEICFVPGNDYKAFLKSHLGEGEFHPGGIYTKEGERVGEHEGIEFYTVGQRKGLGLGGGTGQPLYVIDIDPATQSVIVGEYLDLVQPECRLNNTNWLGGEPEPDTPVEIKIRYNFPAVPARVQVEADRRARVVFDEPQAAISPGQAGVCYQGDHVLGGGWIERVPLAATPASEAVATA